MIEVPFELYDYVKAGLGKSSPHTAIRWTWLPRKTTPPFIRGWVPNPGYSFNAWRGCVKVSEACQNCYAESVSKRNPGTLGEWGKNAKRVVAAESYWKLPSRWNKTAEKDKARRGVFSLSMGDVFERYEGPRENVVDPDGNPYSFSHGDPLFRARERLFATIMECQWLVWMLLTKRPENILPMLIEMRDFQEPGDPFWQWLNDWIEGFPPNNVWLGTTVETQRWAEERIPHLAEVPAVVRFLSMEPLMEKVNIGVAGPLHWVIAGGESGPGFRSESANPEIYRDLRDQCRDAGVAFFMKQMAGFRPLDIHIPQDLRIRQYPGK